MPNNAMFLTCGVCGDRKIVAKYYPSTGWYVFPPTMERQPETGKEDAFLTDWFEEHEHVQPLDFKDEEEEERWFMFGPTHFQFSYLVDAEEVNNGDAPKIAPATAGDAAAVEKSKPR